MAGVFVTEMIAASYFRCRRLREFAEIVFFNQKFLARCGAICDRVFLCT